MLIPRHLSIIGKRRSKKRRDAVLGSMNGREALTEYRVLASYQYGAGSQLRRYSLLKAILHTGRTHQIRVHASHLGAPLAGDKKYSSARQQRFWRKLGLRRMFLHASGIEFEWPAGTPQAFNAQLPPSLRRCLDRLEGAD